MQWSDVTVRPTQRTLRQFAVLSLVVFGGLATWRWLSGELDAWTWGLGVAGAAIGGVGTLVPSAVRPIYTGWMIAAFPIGWVVSTLVLASMFFLMFGPIALLFRLLGRDALGLRRRSAETYWTRRQQVRSMKEYLRQF